MKRRVIWLAVLGALLLTLISHIALVAHCACGSSPLPLKTTHDTIAERCVQESWLARTNCVLDIVEAYYTDGRYGARFLTDEKHQFRCIKRCLFSLPAAQPVSLE
jgi:hypothetical protein